MDGVASENRDLVERLLPQVRSIMMVEASVRPSDQTGLLAEFRGKLKVPSDQAYDRLQPVFEREGVTLLLRQSGGLHLVLAVDQLPKPGPSRIWINVVMFVATLGTVFYTGLVQAVSYLEPGTTELVGEAIRAGFPLAMLFTVSLLGILLAHEFGHYLMGRYHKTPVSLPYFIPFPNLFGTLGAFIQLKSPPRNRRALLDIGIAGPLAGMVVAVPVILIGLALSNVTTLPSGRAAFSQISLEGNSVLYLAAKFLATGKLLPAPASYGGVSPILYWLRYFFTGMPLPFGGQDVLLHPLAWAGWIGFLVTGINLIPVGQLDGGHAMYSLLGRRARSLWLPLTVSLVVYSLLLSPGWLLFAGLLFFFGRTYATPLDDVTPLDGPRKAIAIFAILLFFLTFVPNPGLF